MKQRLRVSMIWLMIGIGLLSVLVWPARAATRRKGSPAQVVQAFLSACYSNKNEDAWAGREEIERFGAEPDNLPPGAGACYSIAAERWAVRGTRVKGNTAAVETDIWIWERQDCDWSERHYPAKRTRLTFTLVRKKGVWRLKDYHPLVPRKRALEARDRPFYLVIAGSFRTKRAAERHMQQFSTVLNNDQTPTVVRSGDFATLERGWFVVLPSDGETTSLSEAQEVRKRLTSAGVSAYVRRIR